MKRNADDATTLLQERCVALTNHVKLLRDYATTPDNVWLARSELSQIQQLVSEIEQLLTDINRTQKR
jgi:hypothetical protein